MKYKRLTRRNKDGTTWVKCAVCDIQDKCDFTKETCCQELQDRLAELEDKIERGELVENNVITYVNMARSGSKTLIHKALKYDELKAKIEQGTLKEEKTCTNISEMHPVDGFTCSECGISLEDYSEKEVDEENDDITYREYMLRYCPNCGAKIVY